METKIIKEADDPLGVTRVSIGGRSDIGYYAVYRGNLLDAITATRLMLGALEKEHAKTF